MKQRAVAIERPTQGCCQLRILLLHTRFPGENFHKSPRSATDRLLSMLGTIPFGVRCVLLDQRSSMPARLSLSKVWPTLRYWSWNSRSDRSPRSTENISAKNSYSSQGPGRRNPRKRRKMGGVQMRPARRSFNSGPYRGRFFRSCAGRPGACE